MRVKKQSIPDLDRQILKGLKYICKLPQRASKTMLYASRSVGGLALPVIREEADIWTVAKSQCLLNSNDTTTRALANRELGATIAQGLRARQVSQHKFLSLDNDEALYDFLHHCSLAKY